MNVIVIACNGLHLGFLGPYGNPWIETPHLDRLAAEGVVFDHHFPENLTTLPTRRSWWTGRYAFANPEHGWTPLQPDEVLLPDFLHRLGVRSAFLSDVPMLRQPGYGYGRGFDEVIWVRGQGYDPYITPGDPRAAGIDLGQEPGLRLPLENDPDHALWKSRWEQYLRNRAALGLNRPEGHGAVRLVDEAMNWLERRRPESEPFLLWMDLFSPHGPWDPPESYRDRYVAVEPDEFETEIEGDLAEGGFEPPPIEAAAPLIDVPPGAVGEVISEEELLRLRRTYAGCVTFLDEQLGRLFETLQKTGRYEDTLVVFTSDQGEPLGEHGYVRRFRPWLYEELVHTPLILRMPGGAFGGTRRQAIVQTVDLLPTILQALIDGRFVPDEEEPPIHGSDLLPLVRGEQTKLRDYACMGMDVEEFALRTHYWHFLLPMEAGEEEPPRGVELYRKPEDRWDQLDVAGQHPDLIEHLELVLRRFVECVGREELDALPSLRDLALFPPQA